MARLHIHKKSGVKLSPGASLAKIHFEEAKHKRDIAGKFADKPGAGNDAPSSSNTTGKAAAASPAAGATGAADKAAWQAAAKTTGVTGADRIKLHVDANPKKAGSAAADRFANYKDGMTTGEFRAAGGTAEDLAWDRKKGYITIHDEPTYQKLAGSPGTVSHVADIHPVGATGRLAAIKSEPPPIASAPVAVSKGMDTIPPTEAHTEIPAPGTVGKVPSAVPPLMPNDHRYKADELVPLTPDKMADEGDKGLQWEYEKEYIQYGGKGWAPGIQNQEHFNKLYKAAPLTYLNDSEYDTLGYTSVNTKRLPTFNDVAPGLKQRKRDPEGIRERMRTGVTTPPIVLRKNGKLRLMAGQSRIFVGLASGFRVPVKILEPGV
jgi:hypothetical protein